MCTSVINDVGHYAERECVLTAHSYRKDLQRYLPSAAVMDQCHSNIDGALWRHHFVWGAVNWMNFNVWPISAPVCTLALMLDQGGASENDGSFFFPEQNVYVHKNKCCFVEEESSSSELDCPFLLSSKISEF